MKILKESIIKEDHHRNPGDDAKMAKIQLKSIQDNVAELLDKIQDDTQLDAWVQSLISKSQDDISAVRDYMVYGEDEEVGGPEIITDLPPMDVAPEAPVPVETPEVEVDVEDELEMDDLVGPGPEVAGEEGDIEGAMEPAESIPLDLDDEEEMEEMVEYGDEHPAGEWQRQEADRRWQRDEEGMYDPDDELENPEDYMEEDYMMESLDNFMVEKEFSEKKREKLASSGAAMKDGSYPIESKQDLKNAIKAYGRAKNKAATKRHIMKRARALGATGDLPEDWKVNEGMDSYNQGKRLSVELDTAVDVEEHADRDWVIDRYGDNEEEHLLKLLNKNGIEYEVIDPSGPGGGWPVIEYYGTLEQLLPFLAVMSPSGYSEAEIADKLKNWDGDQDDPVFQEVMH